MTDARVTPRYGEASIADILPSALAVLGVPGAPDVLDLRTALDGVRRIGVLLLDGLGYHLLPAAAATSPVLADVLAGRLGSLSPLTCGFPSTTPTSLVSLGTGAAPGAHGVLGFTLNVPGTSEVLTHIQWRGQPDPATWQPVPTAYTRASAAGIHGSAVLAGAFVGSGLTDAAYRGARYVVGSGVDEVAAGMLRELSGPAPTLVYGYHGQVDSDGHVYGLGSEQWRTAIGQVDELLSRLVDGLPADAALLVTADHGQLDIPADRRFDLDSDPRLLTGVRVVAGEPRVRYLHTLPGARDDVLAAWRAVLGPAAWVVPREEAVAGGWFGPVPEEHLARIGDVVAVCNDDYAVLASAHEPDTVGKLIAFHGSWTAAEMTIPLMVLRRP
jgi:Type I phosphodiesterase / nucleotide pyrophosphatase